MEKSKLLLVLLFLISTVEVLSSQELPSPKRDGVSIGETTVSMGDNELIIDYGILLGDQVLSCKVGVTMLLDGRPFREAAHFTGDIGKIRKSGTKQIRYDIRSQKEKLAGKEISFKLDVSKKDVLDTKFLLMASASPLSPRSYGLMVGAVKKVGGYARFQSNFRFSKPAFNTDLTGAIDNGGYMWATGNSSVQTLSATAGVLFRAHKAVYPYAGAGYGHHRYLYEDISGDWGLVKDISPSGLALEAGLVFKAGPIAISAGASSIMFRTISLDLGLGVLF